MIPQGFNTQNPDHKELDRTNNPFRQKLNCNGEILDRWMDGLDRYLKDISTNHNVWTSFGC